MENILLTLVVVLLVLLIFLMGGLAFIGLKILKKKQDPATASDDAVAAPAETSVADRFHPEIKKRVEEAQKLRAKLNIEANCHNHPKEPSEASCAICDKYFCKSCIKTHQNLVFCREHVGIYLNSHWAEVHSIKSTPEDPEAGVALVEWKKEIWEREALPLWIQTHYKINVDGDQIESWVVLYARENEKEDTKKRLAALKRPAVLDQ